MRRVEGGYTIEVNVVSNSYPSLKCLFHFSTSMDPMTLPPARNLPGSHKNNRTIARNPYSPIHRPQNLKLLTLSQSCPQPQEPQLALPITTRMTSALLPLPVGTGPTEPLIALRLGTPIGSAQTFLLPERQINFYSPYLRTLIERASPRRPLTLILPNYDPDAFKVVNSWMNYASAARPCHQKAEKGGALEGMLEQEDVDGVVVAFKVWVLAHRLGGPCLVLRDECMRFLYETYTLPDFTISPASVLYVFTNAGATKMMELDHFLHAILARDGLHSPDNGSRGCTWDHVLEYVEGLKQRLETTWGYDRAERFKELKAMEVYMCTPGEVTPDWCQDEDMGGTRSASIQWMNKNLRETLG